MACSRRGSSSTGGWCAAGRNFCVEALHGVLKINELLIELAEARLYFFKIVREALDLRGHGIQPRAGIGLHVLHRFLQRAHGAVQLVDVVIETANNGLDGSVVLNHLRGDVFLSLEQGSDVALEVDNFAGDGFDRAGADEASANGTGENGGTKNSEIAYTHDQSS